MYYDSNIGANARYRGGIMAELNTFFKNIADKLSLPDFFGQTTLLFNNLFLAVVAAVSFILLLLVIILMPGRRTA